VEQAKEKLHEEQLAQEQEKLKQQEQQKEQERKMEEEVRAVLHVGTKYKVQ
jgi:hypothetical protein